MTDLMQNYTLSVITPVYNGEAHIENCLQTVIEQHCSRAEHIVIDGHSDDSTVNIVKKYAAAYPHIRWVSEPDKGQSDAMNKGIAMAMGDILAILNVDDYYEPGVLNRVISLFTDLPAPAMLVGNCNVWCAQGKLKYINKPAKLDITELLLGWKINQHPVNPSAYFYHKSLHDIVGLYDPQNHYAMDLDFLLLAAVSAKTHYVDEIFGNYRLLDGTKTVLDQQRGEAQARSRKIHQKHFDKLRFGQKVKVNAMKIAWKVSGKLAELVNRLRHKLGIRHDGSTSW